MEKECEDVEMIHLAQDRVQMGDVLKPILNLGVL
jgi:hypothetical protein